MDILKYFFAIVVFVSVFGCATKDKSAQDEKLERKIGVILPLESNLVARDVADGMRLAVKLHNTSVPAQERFQVFFEDVDKQKKKTPLKVLERLSSKGVRVFCAGFDAEILPVHKLFSSMNGAFFNFLMTYPPASVLGKNSTRMFFNSAQEGDMMASFESTSKVTSLTYVIIAEDSSIGKSASDFLSFSLSSKTRKVIREFFTKGEKNFDLFAEQIVAQNPKAIFYVGDGTEFASLSRALKSREYKGVLVKNRGSLLFDKSSYFGYGVCAKFELDKNFSKNFKDAFAREYKREASVFAAWGFDNANILFNAMKSSDFQMSSLRGQFINASYSGAMGKLIFDSSADCTAELVIK